MKGQSFGQFEYKHFISPTSIRDQDSIQSTVLCFLICLEIYHKSRIFKTAFLISGTWYTVLLKSSLSKPSKTDSKQPSQWVLHVFKIFYSSSRFHLCMFCLIGMVIRITKILGLLCFFFKNTKQTKLY